MGIKDELLSQLPKLALMAMAGKTGGLPAVSAFLGGQRQGDLQQQQLQRQADGDARAQEWQQAQMANMESDNTRLLQQDEMAKFQRAVQMMQAAQSHQAEFADDPIQADAAMQAQAGAASSAYGVPQEQLTPFVPPMAPMISARKKRNAKARYAEFVKTYGDQAAEVEGSLSDQSGEFAGMTFAKIRETAEAIQPPAPQKRALQMIDLGGKKVAIDPTQLEHGDTFTETPAASRGGAAPAQEPLVAIMGPDGVPVLVPRSQAIGKRPASTREQGRPVMSSDANRIADLDTSLNDLTTLEQEISVPGGTGYAAKAGAALWSPITEITGVGSDAKQRQATIDRVKQVIGKALEGGVLRKEDEYKYTKILPTILDPPEVAAKKIVGLRAALQQRRTTTLEALGDAGFDTSKFSERVAPSQDAAPAGPIKVGKYTVTVK